MPTKRFGSPRLGTLTVALVGDSAEQRVLRAPRPYLERRHGGILASGATTAGKTLPRPIG